MKQTERILRHIKDYGSITSLEAVNEYGIMRLASRMSELKKAGYSVRAEFIRGKNRYGEARRYSRYTIDA